MKASEYRGLPMDELQGLLTEARQNLHEMQFQKGVRQLDNPSQIREARREISLLMTLIGEESLKQGMERAKELLSKIANDFKVRKLADLVEGERLNQDRAGLQKAVRILHKHPQSDQFRRELIELRGILLNKAG